MKFFPRHSRFIFIIGIFILAAGLGQADSMSRAASQGGASVAVIEPLAINKTADLKFGRVFFSTSAQTVTVAPDGTRSASNNAILGDGDPVSAAAFLLRGQPGDTFHVFQPPPTITMTNGTQNITVSNFVCSIKTSNNGVLGSDGLYKFTYGATVNINAGQSPGWYTGTFLVAVNYQ